MAHWLFKQWEMNIIEPFSNSKASNKNVLLDVDYFTKWIEVQSCVQVKDTDVKTFLWKIIICNFGIPRTIVADNGFQFISFKVKELCTSRT